MCVVCVGVVCVCGVCWCGMCVLHIISISFGGHVGLLFYIILLLSCFCSSTIYKKTVLNRWDTILYPTWSSLCSLNHIWMVCKASHAAYACIIEPYQYMWSLLLCCFYGFYLCHCYRMHAQEKDFNNLDSVMCLWLTDGFICLELILAFTAHTNPNMQP